MGYQAPYRFINLPVTKNQVVLPKLLSQELALARAGPPCTDAADPSEAAAEPYSSLA